jgi:hypothetical protein
VLVLGEILGSIHNVLDGLLDQLAFQAPDLGGILDRCDGAFHAIVGNTEFLQLAAVHVWFPVVFISWWAKTARTDQNADAPCTPRMPPPVFQ